MPPFRPRPPSDRQPGIEQANNRQRSFGFNPRQQQRPGGFQPRMTPPMGGTIGRPPMQGETGRSLGPAGGPVPPTGRTLSRLGDLPGARPSEGMIDQISDIFGVGDRRKERYIADTQGGYPNRGIRSLPEYMDPMPMPWDYESPMPSPMPLPRDFETGPMEPMAAVDPSDWRTLETILGAGGNPDDYMQSAGIMGAMPEERQMAEVGLPKTMDWQNERLPLKELQALDPEGTLTPEQIAAYYGWA